MGKRKTINLISCVEKALEEIDVNTFYYVKENTIIQAAILMFYDASEEKQKEYLSKIRRADARRKYNYI